jgi:hypothetical protein
MKHNKKRNVGLIYELLTRYVSSCVIENNLHDAKKAVKIIEKRFRKDTELYKEFRIFNALLNSTVSETSIAVGVLSETKNAVRNLDYDKLNSEKSLLIRDINYQLKKENFYHERVDNYKIFASIQNLLNEYKSHKNFDLEKLIKLEKIIVERLVDANKNFSTEVTVNENVDNLVLNIMTKKINEKYNQTLTSQQKEIIRNYAIYHDDKDSLQAYLTELKINANNSINTLIETCENKVLLEKVDAVKASINNLRVDNIDDTNIAKFLTLSKLKDEILGTK